MKPISDFPNYFITIDGAVISTKYNKKRRLQEYVNILGYVQVILCRKGKLYCKLIHRLVLETFVGKCPKNKQCRHLDGIKCNNHLSNLCWGTRHENQMDRKLHGTFTFSHGEDHYLSKLTELQVKKIRELSKLGYRQHEIAKMFSICRQTVSQIVLRKSWKHIKAED